ncbi:glycosyltransferase family 39 protein, partial [Candidatus Dependentiae bacterium]|nr:glycosyltransferase family 39 protein [Candidatus Dependentiae bacterium]
MLINVIKNNIVPLFFCLISSVLLLWGLDNNYFWEDEADTAIYAKNILKSGLPSGWNGKNLYAYRDGLHLNSEMVNKSSPWLQFYVTALAFKIFGKTVFAGRFLFVLTGIVSIYFFYKFILSYSDKKLVAVISSLYLIFSPSFLLFTRQCRYYSLVIISCILMFYSYTFISIKNKKSLLLFTLSCILFFYSNYFIFFAFFTGLFFSHIILEFEKEKFKGIIFGGIVSIISGLPYLLYGKPWNSVSIPFFSMERLENAFYLFVWYLRDYNTFSFFQAIFIILLPFVFIEKTEKNLLKFILNKKILLIIIFILFSTVFLSWLSPQPYKETLFADIRYAVGLFPFFCFLIGYITSRIFEINRIFAIIILIISISTNYFTLIPSYRSENVRFFLFDYIYEITHKYITPTESVIDFIEKNIKKSETILIRPEYCVAPIFFYFDENLLFCGSLSEDNQHILISQKNKIPEYIYSRKIAPDWIISFGLFPYPPEYKKYLDFIKNNKINYSLFSIEQFCVDMTRPEIIWHSFYPVKNYSPENKIYILKMKYIIITGGIISGIGKGITASSIGLLLKFHGGYDIN